MNSAFAVILDACTLYPAPLRDLLLELAAKGVYRARWTAKIHDEWMGAVLRDNPDVAKDALERTRTLMDLHAEHCLIDGYESLIPCLALPDPNDRHVLAAAIRGRVDAIVSFNKKDFPAAALEPYDIELIHPDDFLTYQIDLNKSEVVAAARRVRQRLKSPPKTAREYLDTLIKQKLPNTVIQLESDITLI
ncbi:MAG: PIN domain-containing protein [Rhodospirillales bacterium]|nr:MAG: PIN domain-containing protein [Rhodospirillales bacterium]